jgi:hypothetical protein
LKLVIARAPPPPASGGGLAKPNPAAGRLRFADPPDYVLQGSRAGSHGRPIKGYTDRARLRKGVQLERLADIAVVDAPQAPGRGPGIATAARLCPVRIVSI